MRDEVVEHMARVIHENYLANQTARGIAPRATPSMVPWADLDEDKRDANRAQARAIETRLARVDCTVSAVDAAARPPFTFTESEVELLAREEHDRWAGERQAAGWVYGAVRADRTQRHPLLVPWEQLSEHERDKDRDAIRAIPALLATVGLEAVRGQR